MAKRVADFLAQELLGAGMIDVLLGCRPHAKPDRPRHRPQPDRLGPYAV